MNTKDELIDWLRDAYAMEKAMEIALKNQMDSDDTLQPLRDLFETHLEETRLHAASVEACLASLGSQPSTVKTSLAEAIETVKGLGSAFAKDTGVKAMLASYAAEHFEIGCYLALISGARNLGLEDIARRCEQILADEQRMADWLQANISRAVTSYLKEVDPADDNPESPTQAIASSEKNQDEEAFRAATQAPVEQPPPPTREVEDIDTPVEAGADDDPAERLRETREEEAERKNASSQFQVLVP